MSLKFGIYLVEQRVISAEQFCGLVKIQQESAKTMATISLRKNLMTIKQVNHLLNLLDGMPDMTFEGLALEKGMIDAQDLEIMRKSKEVSCPPIRRLLVECGLLTQHQTKVLQQTSYPGSAANPDCHGLQCNAAAKVPAASPRDCASANEIALFVVKSCSAAGWCKT